MSEGMDRSLSIKESMSLKMHLFFCAACKQILKQLKGLRRLLRTYRNHLISKSAVVSGLSQKAKDKIKQIICSKC